MAKLTDAQIIAEELLTFAERVVERTSPPYDWATEAANQMELYDWLATPLPPELAAATEVTDDEA